MNDQTKALSTNLNGNENKKLGSYRMQILLIIVSCALYFFLSFSRSSLSANFINFADEYGVSDSTVGLIWTFYSIAYGAGQIINSIFITKYNKRFSIAVPIALEGLFVLLTFIQFDIEAYRYIWLSIGICHSFFWMSLMKILSENIDEKLLSKASVILSITNASGAASAYLISSLLTHLNYYRLIFIVGGVGILTFVIVFFVISWKYKCSPKEYGVSAKIEERKYIKKQKPKYVFLFFGALVVFALLGTLGSDSLKLWAPRILKNGFGLVGSLAIFISVVLPIVQAFVSVFTVFIHKKFRLRYHTIICGSMFITTLLMGLILITMQQQLTALFIVFASISFFCFIILNFLGTNLLPLERRAYFDSGLAAGIINGGAYVGSALSTYIIVLFVEATSWNHLFVLLMIISLLLAIISLLLILIFGKKPEYKDFI